MGSSIRIPAGDFNPRPPCGGRRLVFACAAFCTSHFNPRPPCGGRRRGADFRSIGVAFQSTPPVWGATIPGSSPRRRRRHFNPRPPCGGRPQPCPDRCGPWYFNPRPPCGGRLTPARASSTASQFQSTPPVWGATRCRRGRNKVDTAFQSTPPVWGATGAGPVGSGGAKNFNPRPPCGGRHHESMLLHLVDDFNPRPPCGGRPLGPLAKDAAHSPFQSTPPVWGATDADPCHDPVEHISIHAPRVGGDQC